jgi:hypothetical protein
MNRNFPIIIVNQSGRASDAMACFIKHHENSRKNTLEVWGNYLEKGFKTDKERQDFTTIMIRVGVICVLFACYLRVVCVLFACCLRVVCVLFALFIVLFQYCQHFYILPIGTQI